MNNMGWEIPVPFPDEQFTSFDVQQLGKLSTKIKMPVANAGNYSNNPTIVGFNALFSNSGVRKPAILILYCQFWCMQRNIK